MIKSKNKLSKPFTIYNEIINDFKVVKFNKKVKKLKFCNYRLKRRIPIYSIRNSVYRTIVNLKNLKKLTTKFEKQKLLNKKKKHASFGNFAILFKLNNSHNTILRANQTSLREKYSFFNHFFYRKSILRRFLRIRSYNIKVKTEGTNLKTLSASLLYFYKSISSLDNKKSLSNDIDDFSIQRIRFKPGYQVIWRKARVNLQELLGLKTIYQKKLTRILSRFYRLSHFNTCSSNVIIAEKAILASRLLPDPSTISSFIKSGYVFLNGVGLKNQKSLLFYGDFLQLRLSIWATSYSNFLSKWYKFKFNKLKTFAKKKKRQRIFYRATSPSSCTARCTGFAEAGFDSPRLFKAECGLGRCPWF